MDGKSMQGTVDFLQGKSTEELYRFYRSGGYTDAGYAALRQVLTERNVPIPEQIPLPQQQAAITSVTRGPVGIGGWLILPAIGLVLGSILSVVGLVTSFAVFSDATRAGYGGYLTLRILIDIGLLIWVLIATIQFFGKKTSAPSTVISLMTAQIIVSIVLLVITAGAGAVGFAIPDIQNLAGSIIRRAIWAPYFRMSQRVKATFVNY